MPHLVQGHVRFTAEDFLFVDYQTETLQKNANKTYAKLVEMLKANSEQMALMKDADILELFNTQQNIKQFLVHSLGIITSLAEKEGYSLTDLMRL
jgi:hypothetical protein